MSNSEKGEYLKDISRVMEFCTRISEKLRHKRAKLWAPSLKIASKSGNTENKTTKTCISVRAGSTI